MTTMDYRTIPSSHTAKDARWGLGTASRENGTATANATEGGGDDGSVTSRLQKAISDVLEGIKSRVGDLPSVYIQPLDPSEDISMPDRASLVLQSVRPWGEFFNLREFNLPPRQQIMSRLGHNIETFFYNYFLLTGVHLLIFTIFHFGCVFWFAVWLALMYFLYVWYDGDIQITDTIKIDSNIKLGIAIVTALLALVFGGVFSLVISVAVFLLIVVGIHGIIRDDAPSSVQDVAI